MRFGAIPLIVSDHVYRTSLPFQCWVPWKLLVLTIPEKTFLNDVPGSLSATISSLTPLQEERTRQLIGHFGKDVLWRHPTSRVAENVLLAAHRWRKRGKPALGCCLMQDDVVLDE
jgi:hypothetical protein